MGLDAEDIVYVSPLVVSGEDAYSQRHAGGRIGQSNRRGSRSRSSSIGCGIGAPTF
jgi:hypothetical protein